jgi:intracellular sulfur oxidation DsrE/DsrF family protein
MILLASAACDEKKETAPTASATPTPAAPLLEAGAASEPDAAPKPAASFPMPERPVPRPQTMVGSGMPIEVQQRAIGYMVAMRAPHPDDAAADPAYAEELVNKLKPIVMSMDTGAAKARMNRVEVVANGRQIDLLMASGCDEKTPLRAVVTRAATPLTTLVQHGMLVVRCNDSRIQCLQSTRDPDDVLCTTAPRHK